MSKFIVTGLLICWFCQVPLYALRRIAVVANKYDNVERVLRVYDIPFEKITIQDLGNYNVIRQYSSIFLPSGADTPLEEIINVMAKKTSIKSVKLKQNIIDLDNPEIVNNIKRFIAEGGALYCSGYSYKLLQRAFHPFVFHRVEKNDFPNLGLPGRIEVSLHNDLTLFSSKPRDSLYMNHSGWVTIKSINSGQVLTRGTYESPIGKIKGPISILLREGNGEALYTSYYSTVYSEYKRFNILRIAGNYLLQELEAEAKKWNQHVIGRLVDLIAIDEYTRKYTMDLRKGPNSVYFYSENVPYLVDIYNEEMSLIESRDILEKQYIFTINAKSTGRCYIKIYPSQTTRNCLYSFVVASGEQMRTKWIYIIAVSGLIATVIVIFVLILRFKKKRFFGMLYRH